MSKREAGACDVLLAGSVIKQTWHILTNGNSYELYVKYPCTIHNRLKKSIN